MGSAKARASLRERSVRFADAETSLDDTAFLWWSTPGAVNGFGSYRPAGLLAERRFNTNKEDDFSKGRPGPVLKVPPGKTRVTIRLDDDVLDWFRQQVDDAGGGNYQTLINEALRSFVERKQETLETTLRRVIRDELRRAG